MEKSSFQKEVISSGKEFVPNKGSSLVVKSSFQKEVISSGKEFVPKRGHL